MNSSTVERSEHRGQTRINILGTAIDTESMESAVSRISSWLRRPEHPGRYVWAANVHGITEGLRDNTIRQIHNHADLSVPDGMPLTWIGRCTGHPDMRRVYGPDLMLNLLSVAAMDGYTNYFYGGEEGVADDLQKLMECRFPELKIVGTCCPPFHSLTRDEETQMLDNINNVAPDLLWIGMSTPKQEILMAAWKGRVKAKVMLGVGAAFNFHTGRVKQAPAWIQTIGMEWFFRMCMEPRLISRFLKCNPQFVLHFLLQATHCRKYPIDETG